MTNPSKYTIIFFYFLSSFLFDFIARHGRGLQMSTARRLVDIIQFMPLAGDLGFPSVFYRKIEQLLSIIFLYKKKNDDNFIIFLEYANIFCVSLPHLRKKLSEK